ncbi:MAG: hypothetical protein EXR98_15335 [Gemmataceae bacterium]|nr:hypothetical protein [Gemmataceae bacterium]
MIQMPRRNVTRFFIPLIDVLILLFCIFLLMEFTSESKFDKEAETVAEQSAALELLQTDFDASNRELQKFAEDRPRLTELAKLRAELEALQKTNQHTLQQQAYVRIIDIDGKDGSLSYFDDRKPKEPSIKITSRKEAQTLIDRHKEEANGRQVYYYFLVPRGTRFVTTAGQEQDYREWFKGAANSMVKVGS